MAVNKRFTGRHHSKKTKEQMRLSHLGHKVTPTTKKKISATLQRQWGLIRRLEAAEAAENA